MRTLTLLTLLFLAACHEQPGKEPSPPRLIIRSNDQVSVQQTPQGMLLHAQTCLNALVVEIQFATGHAQVWAVPQDHTFPLYHVPHRGVVYAALVLGFHGEPLLLAYNGPHTMMTTTGEPTDPGVIVMWQDATPGGWELVWD